MNTLTDKNVKARKPHRCEWCYCQINKGETHRVVVNTYEGQIGRYRLHLVCSHDMSESLDSFDYEFTPGDGGAIADVMERTGWKTSEAEQ